MRVVRKGGLSSAAPTLPSGKSGHSLKDYVEAFYLRKKLFLVGLFAPPCIAIILSFLIPPIYQASTNIWAKEQRSIDPLRREEPRPSFLKDQQELILSNVVIIRVLESLTPSTTTETSDKTWKDLTSKQQAEKIAQLRKNVDVRIDPQTADGGSSFIHLKVKANRAEKAAQLANLVALKYIDFYYELKTESAHNSYKFLEAYRDQVATTLGETEKNLKDFETKLGPKLIQLIELSKQGSTASLSGAYNFIQAYDLFAADWAERVKTNDLVQGLRKESDGMFVPLEGGSKSPSLNQMQDSVVTLRFKLNNLKQRYSDESREVQMAQTDLAAAESLLFENRTVEQQGMREKLDFMEKRVHKIRNELTDIVQNRVGYEKLRRDVDNQTAAYKKVQEELESARIDAEMSIRKAVNIVVIDKAMPPFKPVWPNLVLNLIVGILVGIVISIWLIMISVSLDQKIRRPEQVPDYLGVDILCSVSSFHHKK